MNKSTVTKYAIGFLVFLAYYLVARNLENKVSLIAKLANGGK